MVKKIIACADIHIRNLRRHDEFQEQLTKFINECKEVCNEYGAESVRIVIAGDLFHNKLDISGEGYAIASWFLRELDKVCKTIVIAGNHDMNMANLTRLDPLSTVFSLSKFNQVYYLDKNLEYESGCIKDENIVWCLYSTFDNFKKPDIDALKLSDDSADGCTYVGLYHGTVKGSKTDVGFVMNNGIEASYFDGVDFCIAGHIHKHQTLVYHGIDIVYCGSLIQQDFGENISGHGYVIWNVDNNNTYEQIDINNPNYSFYNFTINDVSDLEYNMEKIINV